MSDDPDPDRSADRTDEANEADEADGADEAQDGRDARDGRDAPVTDAADRRPGDAANHMHEDEELVEAGSGSVAAGPGGRAPYVESPIIMATVRVVAPFVFTFGLFVMFHGADSSGGGFQGGVIVGTVVLMLGIAFGIENTSEWVDPAAPVALVGAGVAAFLAIGIGTVAAGGAFLDYPAVGVHHASKYGIELVELAIGLIVSGIVTGLFFAIAAGAGGGEST